MRRLLKYMFSKETLSFALIMGLMDCVCDFGWFAVGRFTEVHVWMTAIGVLFWGYVGGITVHAWLHKFASKEHEHDD